MSIGARKFAITVVRIPADRANRGYIVYVSLFLLRMKWIFVPLHETKSQVSNLLMARYGPHDVQACRLLVVHTIWCELPTWKHTSKLLTLTLPCGLGWLETVQVGVIWSMAILEVKWSPDALNAGQSVLRLPAVLSPCGSIPGPPLRKFHWMATYGR